MELGIFIVYLMLLLPTLVSYTQILQWKVSWSKILLKPFSLVNNGLKINC